MPIQIRDKRDPMKKLFILTALVLGCTSIQTHAFWIYVSNYIDQTLDNATYKNKDIDPRLESFMRQKIDVTINSTAGCSNHNGAIGPGKQNSWDVGGACNATVWITFPDGKKLYETTGKDIFVEAHVSDGQCSARWKFPNGNWQPMTVPTPAQIHNK